ncbi:hypothetical protein D2V08_03380 [Flagellimonas lutimaris]|uniref:Uncharacterized protein n=1 Tax=Flagellimonas lutimaris TaxID=475082 RepID=A0A3A1NCI6_9FLAO|nr:hypothetical protein D2V08_03380 [Allomuricauda lutimaris]
MSLEQLASYFQSKLDHFVIYDGVNNHKFDLELTPFDGPEELNSGLRNIGLQLVKGEKQMGF